MGDHAARTPSSSTTSVDRRTIAGPPAPFPPQALARWAALAAERAGLDTLPTQASVVA